MASHLNAIRMFSKSKFDTAVILEDDVSLDMKPYWNKTLQQVMNDAPKDWEILKLHDSILNQKEQYSKLTYPCYNPTIKTGNPCRWSAAAYIIHKRAALKLMRIWNGNTYQLPSNTFHVADYMINDLLTTYVYKLPYFLIRNNNNTQIQKKACTKNNRINRAFLAKMKTRKQKLNR